MKFKLKTSIRWRLLFGITLLISGLFAIILLSIEKREVRILLEETRNRTILLAQYMADVNLQPLVRYDQEAINQNIASRVSDTLLYIIFYDRSGKPITANDEVKAFSDIFCCAEIRETAEPGDRILTTRKIVWKGVAVRLLEVEIPVFLPGSDRKWASVKIGHSLEPMYGEIKKIRLVLLMIGLGGLLMGIIGAYFLARGITRPLKELVGATISIAGGDFSRPIETKSSDEIGELARSFDEMVRKLVVTKQKMETANRQLLQAEKLASIGRLSATIAHEIRNPLTSVKLNIQKIRELRDFSESEHQHLDLACEGIGQIEKFIKELLEFTRVSDLSLDRFSIQQIIEESLKVIKNSLSHKNITVKKNYGSDLTSIRADGDKLRQVFLNLLRNAEEALPKGGQIDISTDVVSGNGQNKIRIQIADNGPGIPEKDWENIFEPFFSTKPAGFGLGLANARKIIEQHNGSIKVARKEGQGSLFVILLPCGEEG